MDRLRTHLKRHCEAAWREVTDNGADIKIATHQTACGFVRDKVTSNKDEVNCFYCRRVIDGKTGKKRKRR
ncbi:hypothetical protein QX249_11785 [Vibrio parahaemolyticus]|uniref:Uncharacterized protein n=1 Tax=Vibrio parahaemolyticus TaxID=670 RepID=A0AAW8PZF4_VIBPH|nr:hypothetical protein [Vibrio parahaemolyticus]EGR2227298.1 hypothetical protein [Vibrio parahaemolyticus]MDS1821347.1 hypothetical protein [Vibrio parahaemolyticus]